MSLFVGENVEGALPERACVEMDREIECVCPGSQKEPNLGGDDTWCLKQKNQEGETVLSVRSEGWGGGNSDKDRDEKPHGSGSRWQAGCED